MEQPNKHITIIGGGLGGSFLATLLANRGYRVTIFEKLSHKEIIDTNAKRSYNITFLSYGVSLLKEAKLWDSVKDLMTPLEGVSTQLSKNTKPIFTKVANKAMLYHAVSRPTLLNIMLTKLEKNPLVTIHYDTQLDSIDRYQKNIVVEDVHTKRLTTHNYEILIGADGANSLVRPFIQQGQTTNHTQIYSPGGYKQFAISKEHVKNLNLQTSIAYTWSAKDKFILAFPNFDGSLACLLIYPKHKEKLTELSTRESVIALIKEDYPHLDSVAIDIAEQLTTNPVGTFVTIHTDPWYYKDSIALIGDAAHGFHPFYGQGTSAAFGDCMTLVRLVDENGGNWENIFPIYQEKRKPHMDALGELSKEGLTRYARNKRADYPTIYDTLAAQGSSIFPKYIAPPPLGPVMNNPENTAHYVSRANKQKKWAKRLGIPVAISILMGLLVVQERLKTKK